MIGVIAWLVQHFDMIAWGSVAAGIGGVITPRFAARQTYSVELEAWIGAFLGLLVAVITYLLGALESWAGRIVAGLLLAGVLAGYWLIALPDITPALHRPSRVLDKTLRKHAFATFAGQFLSHTVLVIWSLIVLVPIWTMIINSLKDKREIFRTPFDWPTEVTFAGYESAWVDGKFDLYFMNSLIVTITALMLIMLIGALAGYALSNWRSRFSSAIYLYFIAGLMVPIRLGTINIVTIVQDLGLSGKLTGLIPIYVAMGLPITAFVLTAFMRDIPLDLMDAARMDGASEVRVFGQIVLPLIRPALATVAVFNMIPIYNDLWFPLILTRAEESRTVTYGVSLLFGQYQTDWNAILSTLSLASLPILLLYLLMSKQFIRGLTAGAVKG
jgi:raffinose/stachyose/melibiose transport system permease protein